MSRSIPPPPRILLIGLAVMTFFSFVGQAWVGHAEKKKTEMAATLETPKAAAQNAMPGVRLVVPDEEGALHLQEEYEQKGFRVTAHPIQISVQVPSGFIVADRLDPEAARPVAEALSKVYHFPVALKQESSGKIEVRVGAVYPKQEDALKVVERLKEIGYVWHVEQNFVEKPKTEFEILIPHVSNEDAKAMQSSLPQRGVQVQIVQSP